MIIHGNDPENNANFHENGTFTDCVKSEKCWCGEELQRRTYGDRDFPECPLHGSAFAQNAEELARELPRPA
jgi:hypothetical protein